MSVNKKSANGNINKWLHRTSYCSSVVPGRAGERDGFSFCALRSAV